MEDARTAISDATAWKYIATTKAVFSWQSVAVSRYFANLFSNALGNAGSKWTIVSKSVEYYYHEFYQYQIRKSDEIDY